MEITINKKELEELVIKYVHEQVPVKHLSNVVFKVTLDDEPGTIYIDSTRGNDITATLEIQ